VRRIRRLRLEDHVSRPPDQALDRGLTIEQGHDSIAVDGGWLLADKDKITFRFFRTPSINPQKAERGPTLGPLP
jgi:hypothetical protein